MLRHEFQRIFSTIVVTVIALTIQASAFVLPAHRAVQYTMAAGESQIVLTAFSLLQSDMQRVLDAPMQANESAPQIIIATNRGAGSQLLAATGVDCSELSQQAQAFIVAVSPRGQLVIAGSDAYGTAYGIIELTRLLGVSAWEWWADVDVEPKDELRLADKFITHQAPNVTFRGVCVGDEDWGLMPWSATNYEPSTYGQVGRKTTEKIFELMLRLRANLYWPPSRPCTRPFELTEGCRELAARYGITLGKNIHEPISIADYEAPQMFMDDGFGYIQRFPTPGDMDRQAGNGVYYHASYMGAPHDYLWLGTSSPFLMFQQLSEAFIHGINRLWVLNVGDIKPLEYQLSLFMDMAWDLHRVTRLTVGTHLEEFYAQTIGRDVARLSSIYMKEYFHLAFQMKPEHMAGTRVEEPTGTATDWNAVHDHPWSEQKIRHRLTRYDRLQRNARWVGDSVRKTHPHRADAYYELVEYPILASAAQNEKYLCAQLARHGISYLQSDNVASTWQRSDLAHNRVQELTIRYNELRNGKWRGIMSSNPHELAVFQPVPHQQVKTPLFQDPETIATFYGASYDGSSFAGGDVLAPVLGLGASIRAMPIPKDCHVTYRYNYNYLAAQFANIEIRLLPTHPIEGVQRFMLTFDGSAPQTFMYETEVGSEQWKRNVLRNYAVVLVRFPIAKPNGTHELKLTALDDGIVVDEIFIRK